MMMFNIAMYILIMIGYVLLQDKYILTSMGILCLITIWHAIVPELIDSSNNMDNAKYADHIAIIVLGILYIIFNITYFTKVILMVRL